MNDINLVQEIILDLTIPRPVFVYANQNDDLSRTIVCHIQNNGLDFNVNNYAISIRIHKANGFNIVKSIDSSFGSVKGNVVSFPITQEMTIAHGQQIIDIELCTLDYKTIIHSCTFILRVRKNSITEKEIVDSDDYSTIYSMYNQLSDDLNKTIEEFNQRLDVNTTEIVSENEPDNLQNGDFWLKILN